MENTWMNTDILIFLIRNFLWFHSFEVECIDSTQFTPKSQ